MQFIVSGQRIAVENFVTGKLYTILWKNDTQVTLTCISIGADCVVFQGEAPLNLFTLTMQNADTIDTIEPTQIGTTNYNNLINKPSINSVTLTGNVSLADLGAAAAADIPTTPAEIGAEPAITSENMLDADLVDDTSSTHKFATAAQLAQIGTNENNILKVDTNAVLYKQNTVLHVGENLIDNVISSQGWTGDIANGFTHTSGNTDILTIGMSSIDTNCTYLIEYDTTALYEGVMFVSLGDSAYVDCYNGNQHQFVTFYNTGATASFNFKPISGFTGTISNISIKKVDNSYTDTFTYPTKCISNSDSADGITGGAWWNVGIGNNIYTKLENGTRNVAIGNSALENIKSGNRNVAVGTFSMSVLQNGENNIAIGSDSMWQTTVGSDNTVLGKNTMGGNGTDVQRNIAIGNDAMGSNQPTAKQTVAIGCSAARYTSDNNTAIGNRAMYHFRAGINNTVIGCGAGSDLYCDGSRNTIIGSNSGFDHSGTSSSYTIYDESVAIGYGAKISKNYQVVIGTSNTQEIVLGNRKLVFNQDGTVSWTTV